MTVLSLILSDGLIYAAWLFIVALGLTLIFGVMKILNVAHGSFYALGAYVSATAVGVYTNTGLPIAGVYAALAIAAILAGMSLGIVLERCVLKRFYGRNEIIAALATYAAFLMIEDVLLAVWGPQGIYASTPYVSAGSIQLGELILSSYDLGLVACAVLLAFAAWFWLHRTRFGRMLLAVIYDRETAAAFGVNVNAVFFATFLIGSVLGALGGALTAPKISVAPGIGVEVIVIAFAVIAIGGMGSIMGTLIGALLVGLCRAGAVHLMPMLEMFVVYLVMAGVLALRPHGLFSRSGDRVI